MKVKLVAPVFLLLPLVLSLLLTMSCSSTKSFRKADCTQKPAAYAQCVVDSGLAQKEVAGFQAFCARENNPLDTALYEQARIAYEKEKCSTPRGVFELQFRTSAGINGAITCPKDLLTTKELRQAVEDGKAAAFAYSQKDLNENELAHAQQRRFNADRNGYDIGLSDRTLLIDTRPDTGARDSYKNQFEKIIDSYPGVVEQELVTRRSCS